MAVEIIIKIMLIKKIIPKDENVVKRKLNHPENNIKEKTVKN